VKGALQTELTVTRNREAITVFSSKQKDEAESDPVRLRLHPVKVDTDEYGFPITAPVLVSDDDREAGAPVEPVESTTDVMAAFVDVLRNVFSTGSKGGTKGEIRSVVTERKLMSKSSFYRGWNELVGQGHLVRGDNSVWFWVEATASGAAAEGDGDDD
jgi:hypothetical protein